MRRMLTGPRPEKRSAIASLSMTALWQEARCRTSDLKRLGMASCHPHDKRRARPAMPMKLQGSCRCGAIRFTLDSHTPAPYQLCYCSICRKQQGGGGYAINLGSISATLEYT